MRRREFLGAVALPTASALPVVCVDPRAAVRAIAACLERDDPPSSAAADESLWAHVQAAYTVDRSVVNLNNGGVSPAAGSVQDAVARHLAFANQLPSHNLWHILSPQRETVRAELARTFGAAPDEIALVRNASEGLQICQLGIDLEPGDEVLTTNQDYPRMLTTFRQRERRDHLRLVEIENLPVPCEDPALIVERFAERITDRTRLILASHVVNLTGQVLPVRELCAIGRERAIPVVIDGAHGFGQFPFEQADLGCDYYATSLHKWLGAPHGTGMLFVRRDRISGLWPLMAAPQVMSKDIRKFEEIGTAPLGPLLGIADALILHHGIGARRKAERLRYLRDYWALRLLDASERVRLLTSLSPRFSCAIGTIAIEGLDTTALRNWLWNEHRILTVAIEHPEFSGLRVSANVYTTPRELDRFVDAVGWALEHGLPV